MATVSLIPRYLKAAVLVTALVAGGCSTPMPAS